MDTNKIEPILEIAKNEPERCKLVDSSKSLEDTKEQVVNIMDKFLGSENKRVKKNKP